MTDTNQIRINELARELEIKAKVLIDFLPEIGVTEKKTHSSSLDLDHAELARKHFHDLAAQEAAAEAAKSAAAKAKTARPVPAPARPAMPAPLHPADVAAVAPRPAAAAPAAAPPASRPALVPVRFQLVRQVLQRLCRPPDPASRLYLPVRGRLRPHDHQLPAHLRRNPANL